MSLNLNAIVTVAEAKAYLKVDDTNLDAILETFINSASAMVEDITKARFKQQFVEEVLDGSGGGRLRLSNFPFLSLFGSSNPEKLANIQFRQTGTGDWYNLFAALTGYSVYWKNRDPKGDQFLYRLDGYVFPLGIQNIRVKYYFGYSDANIPSSVRQVVFEMIQHLHRESKHGSGTLGLSSVSKSVQGQNNTDQLEKLRDRWKDMLSAYIREVGE